jgi:hypothetical protein
VDNKGSWCQMWGRDGNAVAINPLALTEDMVQIETIAHALSNQCRFNGHVKKFFSVAAHCLYVSRFCDEQDALWGLLHDASEAYIVDIPRPLKKWEGLSGYMALEKSIMSVICNKFGIEPEMPESVVVADDLLLQWEIRDNLQPKIDVIFPQYKGQLTGSYAPLVTDEHPEITEREFLHRFAELRKRGRSS